MDLAYAGRASLAISKAASITASALSLAQSRLSESLITWLITGNRQLPFIVILVHTGRLTFVPDTGRNE